MKRNPNIQINVIHFEILIGVCGKAKQWRRAISVFKDIQKYSDNGKKIIPKTSTFEALSKACIYSANVDEAPIVYENLKFVGVPEVLCYATSRKIIGKKK